MLDGLRRKGNRMEKDKPIYCYKCAKLLAHITEGGVCLAIGHCRFFISCKWSCVCGYVRTWFPKEITDADLIGFQPETKKQLHQLALETKYRTQRKILNKLGKTKKLRGE